VAKAADAETFFKFSKTLTNKENRKRVLAFVRSQFPNAKCARIYDASGHGWDTDLFHRECDGKGMTLLIVQTTDNFVFGAFTSQHWEKPAGLINKRDPHAFLFSVDLNEKYPITDPNARAIECSNHRVVFGKNELTIQSNAHKDNVNFFAFGPSFDTNRRINGGKIYF